MNECMNERKNTYADERMDTVQVFDQLTRPDTRPMPVADGWAGAEMRVFPLFESSVTDQPTDRPTDGQSLL